VIVEHAAPALGAEHGKPRELKYGSEFELNVDPLEPHIVVAFSVLAGVAPIENFVSSIICGSFDCSPDVSLLSLQYRVTAPLLVVKYKRDVVFFCSASTRHLCASPETLLMLPRSL